MTQEKMVIGTRGSALALTQTDIVSRALIAQVPGLSIEVRIIQTKGDVNQSPIPLDTVGKGWFTKEIEDALYSKEIDLAVHSLKDMADEMPAGLHIGAYLPREDARDVLVTRTGESLEELKQGAVIGTDSPRRQAQMLALRPDVRMESIRGNVPTRLEKLDAGTYDAVILAAAGLKRLALESRVTRYFEPSEMTPAPGQGILALQCRDDDTRLQEILAAINDSDAARAAQIERSFSRAMEGGCKTPTGAYAFPDGSGYTLFGMTVDTDGTVMQKQLHVSLGASDELGELLARSMKASMKDA